MTNVTIKDPAMEPFFITQDQYGFTLHQSIPGKKDPSKSYDKPHSHFAKFDLALKALINEKLVRKGKKYDNIEDYINDYRQLKEELTKTLNKLA